jgi:hypothetical protein
VKHFFALYLCFPFGEIFCRLEALGEFVGETSGDFSHTLEGISAEEKRFEGTRDGKLDDFIINQEWKMKKIL